MPQLRAVCRVSRLLPDPGTVGVTAIDKRPVEGPVAVRDLGLYADVQADRAHHGGPDKALYAYSSTDAQWWSEQLSRPTPPGFFGENLRIDGIDLSESVIGERWQIGDQVQVEVTMPRTPCATFQRYLDEPQWVKLFAAEGRVGAYLRVLRRGSVQAGDSVVIVAQPTGSVPLRRWFCERRAADAQTLLERDAAGELRIAPALREQLERSLAVRDDRVRQS
ncbi:MOSC domain-containing protein [Rathayibacter toxicus]|uniref:MOSC domain-containing protein n=1 Tax=Rathayibacter toxicus TaxID=145458 RepID=A0A0C5BB27_9MICO|nr:MOSC domain-containing protein [Rathayibacter toxicus]AJM78058.1 molybdenum cofactor sulfurase [Rathayibacter toxicus]ALS57707.1 molybdenum cofactor sulfurase [Rathayibacter toxicus]KKM47291.1 molybdenum cofactor sulfurase [Rathayibacter toxicus]PPG20622.1 MOSC domain-containing protein [Rathayibacter toxicus]PPG45725.1 MOSC domain-containing protein [Rathayibacter toxicus]